MLESNEMSPPQESTPYQPPMLYASESKRMRLSTVPGAAPSSTLTTRASTGAPTAMTNKGSVYKAQRGKAVTAAAVKSKAPTTHRRRGRKGKSVYRGVCVTREGKWRAVIYKERKQLYLGVYESEVDAAKAHDRAARYHFAENAVCNFDNEHEADRQALLHKQRQLLQQQQLAEDRAHSQLHDGGFSVGREEFDDLEEYHRCLDEASCSSEAEDNDAYNDGYEVSCRSTRSMSSSSFAESVPDEYSRHNDAVMGYEPAPVAECGRTGDEQDEEDGLHQGAAGSGGESDVDVAPLCTRLRDMEPAPLEGMGFPYAENLLGYEIKTWCSGYDDDTLSPGSSSAASMLSLGREISADSSAGWGFGSDVGGESSGASRDSSSRASSVSVSAEGDEFVPCALPPLMGISADS